MDLVTTDKLYMRLNTAELEAIIKKISLSCLLLDSPSSNDRDAGFCSASSESEGGDDLALEHTLQRARSLVGSTDEYGSVKEGSALLVRNKRKSLEPSKVVEPALASTNFASSLAVSSSILASGPPKKRIRYSSSADSAVMLTPPSLLSPPQTSHTNLSSAHACNPSQLLPRDIMPNPAHIFVRHPGLTTLHRAFPLTTQPEQQEPLALIARKPQSDNVETSVLQESPNLQFEKKTLTHKKLHDACNETSLEQNIEGICKADHSDSLSRPQQRNYKNMTRERRIEANARERTRVHTISAAYETLRHAVPAYASSQKLSKLSVLRVACSYILTLSRMAGKDYSSDRSEPTIAECIEAITSTIQTEGKVKRKKDE